MSSFDEFSPWYLGEQRLDLALDEGSEPKLYAHRPVVLTVSYAQCEPEGVVAPFELLVAGPSQQSFQRIVVTEPLTSIVFTPREGGEHLVTFREFAHNYWWGRIHLTIEGPTLERARFL